MLSFTHTHVLGCMSGLGKKCYAPFGSLILLDVVRATFTALILWSDDMGKRVVCVCILVCILVCIKYHPP